MNRAQFQAFNSQRLAVTHELWGGVAAFRNQTIGCLISPRKVSAILVVGGVEVEVTATARVRISEFTQKKLDPPKAWEAFKDTEADKLYCVVGFTADLLAGEYTLQLANPQTVTAFS